MGDKYFHAIANDESEVRAGGGILPLFSLEARDN